MKLWNFKKKITPSQKYFERAANWADDCFGLMEASRTRYKIAFLGSLFVNSTLALAIAMMLPLKQIEPLVIHHYENGMTTVDAPHQTESLMNKSQVESDLVRYVTERESFEVNSYRAQYDLVTHLSNHTVFLQYQDQQKVSNPQSPINTLGNRMERSIHIFSVNFLDEESRNTTDVKKNHHNLAEVVFDAIDRDKTNGKTTKGSYNALLSWHYIKPSQNPAERWQNWDGFEVLSYHIQPRNTDKEMQ